MQIQEDTLNTEILFASSEVEVGGYLTEKRQGKHASACLP